MCPGFKCDALKDVNHKDIDLWYGFTRAGDTMQPADTTSDLLSCVTGTG